MSWVRLGWRNAWARPVQAILTAAEVALALALSVSVYLVADASRRAMQQAALPFDVVVGDRGSAMQLAFNAVFLQDVPIGNVAYALYARLREDPRVAWALPLALGDNYRGFRLVCTTAEVFERVRRDGTRDGSPLLSVLEGRTFAALFEAVVGADVAPALGIRVGDTFQAAHGVTATIEPEVHGDAYHVVGVLAPSGHPYARGVFVDIRSVWKVHRERGAGEEGKVGHGAPGAPVAEPPASTALPPEPTLVESFVITLLGALWGVGAGYGAAALLTRSVHAQTALRRCGGLPEPSAFGTSPSSSTRAKSWQTLTTCGAYLPRS